jgi:hypothetical protein
MSIFHKKINLHFYAIIVLWTLIVLASLCVFASLVTVIFFFVRGKDLDTTGKTIIYISLISETLLIALWRISTFRRRDLVRIMTREGVRIKKRNPIFLLLTSWFWSFPQGTLGDAYVIANIYGAYNLPITLGEGTHITPERVYTQDQIDCISLINSPFNVDEEIRIEGIKKTIPNTGVSEIDNILKESLLDTEDFRARLKINKDYLRLIIFSSPWLGERYEKRVIKGFEIFKRMDEVLRSKYSHKKWEGIEMKWNGHKREFELIYVSS